jgi:uncharacterized RDD family membrane protein YckC
MTQEAPTQTVVYCSQCGRALPPSELVQIAGHWVCAECKPAFLSRIMASGPAGAAPLGRQYGGFWMRFGARFIDGLIMGVPILIVALLFIPSFARLGTQPASSANPAIAAFGLLTFFVVSFVAGGCYEILMLKYRSATVGKLACGLKVVRSDGRDLSWGVCVGRFFMWNVVTNGIPYLNIVLMLVSSIMLGVDEEKRALHDRVCDTRVIYK